MQLSPYMYSQVDIFVHVSVCLLAMVPQSGEQRWAGGDVSYFACNQFGLLSLQSIACFCNKIFRCCLLFLLNIASSAKYSMNPAIRETFTAGSSAALVCVWARLMHLYYVLLLI